VTKLGVAFACINQGRLDAFGLRKHYPCPEEV
jgi:hypothetical protein